MPFARPKFEYKNSRDITPGYLILRRGAASSKPALYFSLFSVFSKNTYVAQVIGFIDVKILFIFVHSLVKFVYFNFDFPWI